MIDNGKGQSAFGDDMAYAGLAATLDPRQNLRAGLGGIGTHALNLRLVFPGQNVRVRQAVKAFPTDKKIGVRAHICLMASSRVSCGGVDALDTGMGLRDGSAEFRNRYEAVD